MNILIFILVIVALIVVHEFGHFVAAKLSGMRVDEFGLGYPPRALTIRKVGETEYTLNWLPFGGFVKIYGEDGFSPDGVKDARAFSSKNRAAQALVLAAGVTMNVLFAYVLITGALVMGTPRVLGESEVATAENVELAVANVLPGSPAARAGLVVGESILSAKDSGEEWRAVDPKSFSAFIAAGKGSEVTLEVKRDGHLVFINATPAAGIITSDTSRY